MATDWLKKALSSDKRDFYNFVPQLNDDMSELFVQYFWLLQAKNSFKAKEILRKKRERLGMEPQHLKARPHGERLEAALSAPTALNRFPSIGGQASGFELLPASTSARTYDISTATKRPKLPAALRHKQMPSVITKHQGAARTSVRKKDKPIPKARTTARGVNSADKNEGSRTVSDSDKGE